MRHDPHTLVEGCLIAGFAMGAHAGYIYIRASMCARRKRCRSRSTRPIRKGLLGVDAAGSGWDFDLYLTHGAGAYICGEETALLESLEGRKGNAASETTFSSEYRALRGADHG